MAGYVSGSCVLIGASEVDVSIDSDDGEAAVGGVGDA